MTIGEKARIALGWCIKADDRWTQLCFALLVRGYPMHVTYQNLTELSKLP